jgi:hypothetical protein
VKLRTCLALVAALLLLRGPASAQGFSVNVTVDENGNGTLTNTTGFFAPLSASLQNDPGPGGLNNVLTYNLLGPLGLTAGDVLLSDVNDGGTILDVVRFNPILDANGVPVDGNLMFYSDSLDGFDSRADTPAPPNDLYPNFVVVSESGSEGNNLAVYTPVVGQPGFVAGAAGPVTYNLISGGMVPEPCSLGLLLSGLVAFGAGFVCRRAKR